MDSSKWTILTPILVAIISVSIPILFGLVNAPKVNEPVVTIEKSIVSDTDSKEGLIQMENTGRAPATNITAFVDSNSKIITVSQASSLKITLPGFNNSVLPKNSPWAINSHSFEFSIPKFIQGEGGSTEIKLKFDKPQKAEDFSLAAIYDQGSAVAKIISKLENNLLLFSVLLTIGETIFVIYYYIIYKRKKFVRNLNSNFLKYRRKLTENPENTESFTFHKWRNVEFLSRPSDTSYYRYDHDHRYYSWEQVITKSRKFIKNSSDFIKVHDAIALISKREDYLSKTNTNDNGNLEKTKVLNDQVLTSINYALNYVNWDNYM